MEAGCGHRVPEGSISAHATRSWNDILARFHVEHEKLQAKRTVDYCCCPEHLHVVYRAMSTVIHHHVTPTDVPPRSIPPPPTLSVCTHPQVGMVTTFGNGFWNVRYVGDPGRRIVARGLRPNFHPRCTVLWKGLYDVEKCTPKKRESFLEDVKESFRGF